MKSYAQNGEDLEIWKHAVPQPGQVGVAFGRFLDVGAHDGTTLSNTRLLLDAGWGGVYVEPGKAQVKLLTEMLLAESLRRVTAGVLPDLRVVNKALGGGDPVKLWESQSGLLTTTVKEHAIRRCEEHYVERMCETITGMQLTLRVGIDFDVVSIDAEGMSLDIFKSLWLYIGRNAKVWCVEYDGAIEKEQLQVQAIKLGYQVVTVNSENVVMVRT